VVLPGLFHNAVVAGRLKGRLRLDEVARSLIVEGAGGEDTGSELRQIGQVHAVATGLGGLGGRRNTHTDTHIYKK